MRVYFGQKNPITIADLFNWSVEAGWDMFWIQGVRNYRQELEFYEMLNKLASEVDNGGSEGVPGASSNPVAVPDDE